MLQLYSKHICLQHRPITPELEEQTHLPFVSFLLCSEPILKALPLFFFFLRKLQFKLVSLSKPQWCCDLSVLTMRGDKAEKLIKITHKEIYADVFILSQMLLLGSLGVECELHEGWAKWETFEGKQIIDGLVPHQIFGCGFPWFIIRGISLIFFPHS